MTVHPFVSFATAEGRDTFYLPGKSEGDLIARNLAYDVHRHIYLLRQAYLDLTLDLRVLLSKSDLPDELPESVTSGSVLGVPFHVVDGIEQPMIAHNLQLRPIP